MLLTSFKLMFFYCHFTNDLNTYNTICVMNKDKQTKALWGMEEIEI